VSAGGGARNVRASGSGEDKCSVGLLVRKDGRGYLKVRGFAPGGPAERSGKIEIGQVLVETLNPKP
jgi:hypothetical protein